MIIKENNLIYIDGKFLLVDFIDIDEYNDLIIYFDTIVNQNNLEHLKIKSVEEGSIMYNKIMNFVKYKNYIAPLEIIRDIKIKEILNIGNITDD